MKPAVAPEARIRELEERLLQADTRASVEALDALIADDFVEIAGTGRSFGKDEVLSRLPREAGRFEYRIDDFLVRHVGTDLVLATYRARIIPVDPPRQHRDSLRSSLWRRGAGGWQMVFHQGTPTAPRDEI